MRAPLYNTSGKHEPVDNNINLIGLTHQAVYVYSQKYSYHLQAAFPHDVLHTSEKNVQADTEKKQLHKLVFVYEKALQYNPEDYKSRFRLAEVLELLNKPEDAFEQYVIAKKLKKYKAKKRNKQSAINHPLLKNNRIRWQFLPMFKSDQNFTPFKLVHLPLKYAKVICALALLAFISPYTFAKAQNTTHVSNTNKEICIPSNKDENKNKTQTVLKNGFPPLDSDTNNTLSENNSLHTDKTRIFDLLASLALLLLLVFSILFLQNSSRIKKATSGRIKIRGIPRRDFIKKLGLTGAVVSIAGAKSLAIDSDSALPDSATIPTNLVKGGLNTPNSYSTRYRVVMDKEGDKPTVGITNISDNLTYDVSNVQETGSPREFTFDLNLYTGNTTSTEDLNLEVKKNIPDGIISRPIIREDLDIKYDGLNGKLTYDLGSNDSNVRVSLVSLDGKPQQILHDGPAHQGENLVDRFDLSNLAQSRYIVNISTSEGHKSLNIFPGQSNRTPKMTYVSSDSMKTKSASTDSLEQAIINIDTEGLTTRQLGDHLVENTWVGSAANVRLKNKDPSYHFPNEWELSGYKEDIDSVEVSLSGSYVTPKKILQPEDAHQIVYFDIKAPDYDGAPSGITQRITQWLDRYETTMDVGYTENGVDKEIIGLKIPDYVAGLLMQHEDWDPENVDFAETTLRSRETHTANFETLMNKLRTFMTDPQYSEQKAWLKNLNTDYKQKEGVWVNNWYEQAELLANLSEDPLKVDDLYARGVRINMKDHA